LNPKLKAFPFIFELVRTDDERSLLTFLFAGQSIGRPFVAPPALENGKSEMLRKAFEETMRDPEFLAETAKAKLEVSPSSGEKIESIIARAYATPRHLIDRVVAILSGH
jgi:hypothetical protein